MSKYCINKRTFWSEEEIKLLIDLYPISSRAEIQAIFPNRTLMGIIRKSQKLNLKKTEEAKFRIHSDAGKERAKDRKIFSDKAKESWPRRRKSFKGIIGENHPAWKGGPRQKRARDCTYSKEWKKQYF